MDIFKIIIGIVFLNMIFEIYIRFFPYSKRENIMVYQIWLNIVFIMYIILPKEVGTFWFNN